MFTGIIEEIGTIRSINRTSSAYVLMIEAKKLLDDVKLGDSISVNGICLTVTSFQNASFTVDVMPETLRHTNLQALKKGDAVNLERAMAAGGRFGGHFVSGHIDGVGEIIKKSPQHNAIYYEIKADSALQPYFVNKGSVAVDGTSLTIFDVTKHSFTLSLIPHTIQESVIGQKQVGDLVNIECDMLVKYINHLMGNKESSSTTTKGLTRDYLNQHGF